MRARLRQIAALLACGVAATSLQAVAIPSAHAQASDPFGISEPGENEQLLLAADSLIYDFDNSRVTAVGGVQIKYAGNSLVAQRVTYNQSTGQLVAEGNVELVDPDGTRVFADRLDITDDFADGFVSALRVETTDNTRFAAAEARRTGGNETTFTRGAYTACEACPEKPEKPPTWQVKAETIIWNQEKKTIRFEGARFELFGFSLAALPAFEIADHTVTRKSGFLFPEFGYKSELGMFAKVPYFWAITPNIDLTLKPGYFSNQGAYFEGRLRHRLNNGQYSITAAGINQDDPEAFSSRSVDFEKEGRGMIATKGEFSINPRWTFGWDILAQSDKNFSRTYEVNGYTDTRYTSEVFLTGLNTRNFFDLRAQKFQVQEDVPDTSRAAQNDREALLLPSFDYRYTPDAPVLGGELTLTMNGQNIHRQQDDIDAVPGLTENNIRGLAGDNGRFTAEAEWKRTFITPGGLALTPLAAVRGDARYNDFDVSALNALTTEAGLRSTTLETREAYYDYMATLGFEARYPVLFTAQNSTHIVEPIAQIYARPDSQLDGRFGIPNEDAQSLVFDAASLFERDKFSGFDRVEGGVRANLGIRYSGTFDNGLQADALFGQSYHLSGTNPYANEDLVNVGAYSGLETDTSDFVAMAGLSYATPIMPDAGEDAPWQKWSINANARFDERTFEMRRGEIAVSTSSDVYSVKASYAYIQAQPEYGFPNDRQEVAGSASLRFAENWVAAVNATYDLENDLFSKRGVSLAYDDECFTYGVFYNETRSNPTDDTKRTIGFKVSVRTIGEFQQSQNVDSLFGRSDD